MNGMTLVLVTVGTGTLVRGLFWVIGRIEGSPPEPNVVGPVGRGGARERVELSAKPEAEQSGLCDDDE